MPRDIRTLKRTSFTDEKVCSVPRAVRWTWQGLIANADDYGRLRADVRLLKAAIYPLDDEITAADVAIDLAHLETAGLVLRYEVDGVRYIELPGFEKHQKMSRKYGSDIPAPADAVRTQCVGDADDVREQGARTEGEERSGEGAEKERSGESASLPAIVVRDIPALRPPRDDDDSSELPLSLFNALPPEAHELLRRFYEYPAMTFKQRLRYKAVALQLIDVMDPKHPGVRVGRGNQRVKARSKEHLADVCRDVAKNPPDDRDLVILWVLKKLLDAPKGPSVTEQKAREESVSRQVEDDYDRAARDAGVAWANEHPDEYEPIRAAVEASYQNKTGLFVKGAKQAELTQRCAQACGFPTFDKWQRDREAAGVA